MEVGLKLPAQYKGLVVIDDLMPCHSRQGLELGSRSPTSILYQCLALLVQWVMTLSVVAECWMWVLEEVNKVCILTMRNSTLGEQCLLAMTNSVHQASLIWMHKSPPLVLLDLSAVRPVMDLVSCTQQHCPENWCLTTCPWRPCC